MMRPALLYASLAVVLAAYSPFSLAQEVLSETLVRVVPKKQRIADTGHVRDYGYIEISGDLRRSAVAHLTAAIPLARKSAGSFHHSGEPVVRVFVDSRGGEVLAGLQMGRILRSQAVEVWVDKNAECSSACIFLLAGGVSRVAVTGAKLGIHRPFFRPEEFAELSHSQSQVEYGALAATVKSYLAQMGIADALYDAMIAVPSRRINYLSDAFAESTRLLGDDPAYEEWQRAKDQKAMGPERLEKLERYKDCVNSGTPEHTCSRHLSGW